MKWLKWGLVIVFVVAAVIVFSAKLFNKEHTFYYYPEWNAYYDVRNKNYFYSIDGGKTWDTITNSSNEMANTLGKKIVLQSASQEIWVENEQHRNQYGGTLNDLVGGFLKSGEDKSIEKKKKFAKDTTGYTKSYRDSFVKDSLDEIENWIKEPHEKVAKEDDAKDEESDLSEEEKKSDTEDSTSVAN